MANDETAFAAKVEALEQQLASMQNRLDILEGEALFTGTLLPTLLAMMGQWSVVPPAKMRDFLDNYLLTLESEQACHTDRQTAFEHARWKAETMFRSYLEDKPE